MLALKDAIGINTEVTRKGGRGKQRTRDDERRAQTQSPVVEMWQNNLRVAMPTVLSGCRVDAIYGREDDGIAKYQFIG